MSERTKPAINTPTNRRVVAALVVATGLSLFGLEHTDDDQREQHTPSEQAYSGTVQPGSFQLKKQELSERIAAIDNPGDRLDFLATSGCAAYIAYSRGHWPTHIEGERPLIDTLTAASALYNEVQEQAQLPDYPATFHDEAQKRCNEDFFKSQPRFEG